MKKMIKIPVQIKVKQNKDKKHGDYSSNISIELFNLLKKHESNNSRK